MNKVCAFLMMFTTVCGFPGTAFSNEKLRWISIDAIGPFQSDAPNILSEIEKEDPRIKVSPTKCQKYFMDETANRCFEVNFEGAPILAIEIDLNAHLKRGATIGPRVATSGGISIGSKYAELGNAKSVDCYMGRDRFDDYFVCWEKGNNGTMFLSKRPDSISRLELTDPRWRKIHHLRIDHIHWVAPE